MHVLKALGKNLKRPRVRTGIHTYVHMYCQGREAALRRIVLFRKLARLRERSGICTYIVLDSTTFRVCCSTLCITILL